MTAVKLPGPRLLATAVIAMLVLVPTLVAVAGRDGVSILPGKRIVRRGGGIVSVPSDPEPSPPPPGTPSPPPSPTASASPAASPSPASPAASPSPASPCGGVPVAAGSDLQAVLDSHPAGTTFCLAAGTFTSAAPIVPESGDSLVGAGATQTLVVAAGAPAVFEATGTTGVVFKDLDISGAEGSESCKPACGRGISGGSGLVVDGVRVHDNEAAGIGGTDGPMTITASELDHNGSEALMGCCAAGVKSANAFVITASNIHDNLGVGVWCDVGCPGQFQAVGNIVSGNALGGVRYETGSGPALIQGNVVTNNNLAGQGGHGGIEINSSRNVVVNLNTLGGNGVAGIIAGGARAPGLGDVVITNNTLGGDEVGGCDEGVTCEGNA